MLEKSSADPLRKGSSTLQVGETSGSPVKLKPTFQTPSPLSPEDWTHRGTGLVSPTRRSAFSPSSIASPSSTKFGSRSGLEIDDSQCKGNCEMGKKYAQLLRAHQMDLQRRRETLQDELDERIVRYKKEETDLKCVLESLQQKEVFEQQCFVEKRKQLLRQLDIEEEKIRRLEGQGGRGGGKRRSRWGAKNGGEESLYSIGSVEGSLMHLNRSTSILSPEGGVEKSASKVWRGNRDKRGKQVYAEGLLKSSPLSPIQSSRQRTNSSPGSMHSPTARSVNNIQGSTLPAIV